ncbi:MAG TPA: TRAP transporter permease [bacterium]|nr:TRAP transporter permease [bacterium]
MGFRRFLATAISVLSVGMSLFQLYTGVFGALEGYLQRIIHVAFGFLILLLMGLLPETSWRRTSWRTVLSGFFLFLTVASISYLLWNYRYLSGERFAYVTDLTAVQTILGIGFVALVLEATRRTLGMGLTVICCAFLAYPFAGPWLPGIFRHSGYTLGTLLDNLVLTTDGIFGIALAVSSTYIVLFIIFAAFLETSGFGKFLIDVTVLAAGRLRAGPAKIAVLASGLMGMISGSAVANVVSTGSFTIPLMKRTGYRPEFAGAVEAAASTGGQFMPPVMGAQAFIMTQFTGIPYITIAWYSLLPAVLYYMGIWMNLDLEARRVGLRGLQKEEVGQWGDVIFPRVHLVLPIMLLVGLLMAGYTPMFAAVHSIFAALAVSFLRRETRMGHRDILRALEEGAKNSLPVVAATAMSGIIIGSVTLTGLGERFSASILSLSGGSLFLGLFFTMIASLILGLGLPTIPAYIIQIALVVPALVKLGLPLYIAHLFVIYYACISMITPPEALAAYVAAGIAGGNPTKTGFLATKLGAVAYIVPFMFAYNPALLLVGPASSVLLAVVTASVGVFALAVAMNGYIVRSMPWWQRILCLGAALLLIKPGILTDLVGLGTFAPIYLCNRFPVFAWWDSLKVRLSRVKGEEI